MCAWAGGTFTRANGTNEWVTDYNNGVGIEPARHDTQDNDLATGINQCLNKDGSNSMTGNLNLNNNKLTNVSNATLRSDAANVAQIQDGDFVWLGTTGGTATAQTATAAPAISAYKAGQKFRMKVGSGLGSTGSTNTAHTLNLNGLGAKNIVNNEDSSNPTIGTWVADALMELVYDGTNFRITNDPGGWLDWSVTATPGGSMTYTSITYAWKKFRKTGKTVFIDYQIDGTTGGTASNYIDLNLPVNATIASNQSPFVGMVYDTAWQATQIALASGTTLRHYRDVGSGANFNLGASKYLAGHLRYYSV